MEKNQPIDACPERKRAFWLDIIRSGWVPTIYFRSIPGWVLKTISDFISTTFKRSSPAKRQRAKFKIVCWGLWPACLLAIMAGGGWSVFWAVIVGVPALILLINYFRGPTCETYLMTAVQTEKLHSLHRIKITQPVMNQLRSLIEQRQGRFNPETANYPASRPAGSRRPQTLPNANKQVHRQLRHEKGRVHLLLFALLVVEGLIAVIGFLFHHLFFNLMGSAIMMLLGICVVVALVKQHESNLKRALRTLTWAALGCICFSFVAGYIVSVELAFRHPEILRDQWELFKLFSSTTPWESPLMMTTSIADLGSAAFIGIPGLVMLKNPHQTIPRFSPLPAASAPIPFSKRFS